jgi:hypothetical protein
MLPKHAENKGDGYALEPAIADMYESMATGKFTIASHCNELIEEYLSYHRDEDLKIVAIRDDVLSAVRYAHMMRRSGKAWADCDGVGFGAMPYAGQRRAGGGKPLMAKGLDFDLHGT